ncbi:hypothetical protein ACJ41O_007322 [Fusarium nematophilum]
MSETGTYGIKGLPLPAGAIKRTHEADGKNEGTPYVEGLPVRHEISALANSKDPDHRRQWTLFVLALEKFKLKPIEDKLSYFQVAGIHGYPEAPWDGAPPPREDPETTRAGDQPYGGYCNHNGLNFPTWHRPYMALFEQCIWDNMKDVIDHWVTKHKLADTEAKQWVASKDKWRMPYWDWARKQSYTEDFAYPQILVQGPVRIWVPDAVKEYYPPSGLYANPFWSFENPEKDKYGHPLPFGKMPKGKRDWNIEDNPVTHDAAPPRDDKDKQWMPWSLASGTSRYGIFVNPTMQRFKGLDGVNNPWEANRQLSAMTWYPITAKQRADKDKGNNPCFKWNPGTLADSVNRMFSENYNKTWGQFASTKWIREGHGSDTTGFLSLEYIHNNVHNIVGGSDYKYGVGHMSDVPVAAFDPIFWLHHTQIDRLLAMWQSLNWTRWFDCEEPPGKGNEKDVPDDTPDDYLYPFHDKDNGDPNTDVWTANKCRDWTVFNYQYDDLMDLSKKALNEDKTLNEKHFKCLLRGYINEIYPCTEKFIWSIDETRGIDIPRNLRPDLGDQKNQWHDYIINVVYDRYALGGRSYTIKFYLGGPKNVDKTRFEPQNYVGSVYTFGGGVRSTEESCSNCKKQADAGVLSCAQVPLTIQLLHHAIDGVADHPLKDFEDVGAYLKLHLRWKVIAFGGVELEEEDLGPFHRTKITVYRGIGKPQHVSVKAEALKDVPVSAVDALVAAPIVDSATAVANGAADKPTIALPPVYESEGYQPVPEATSGKPFGYEGDPVAASA